MKVRTADLPADDQFPFWCELADTSHVPTILQTDHSAEWDATMRVYDFGPIIVSRQSHPPCTAHRPGRLIRRSDPELIYLMMPTSGRMMARQLDRDAELGSDAFVVLDTSRPATVVSPTPTNHILLQIPRPMLPANRGFEHLLATPVGAGGGLGGALAAVVRELVEGADAYPAVVVSELTQTVVDLLLAVELATAGDTPIMPAQSRDRARLLQICAYLMKNLTDPNLTLPRVAGLHGISLRQLNRLFQRDGTTPAGWVRDQRLRRCRRDLLDPALSGTPAYAIGARWGFADPVSFHRAFSRAYGMPPGEYRRQFAHLGLRDPGAG